MKHRLKTSAKKAVKRVLNIKHECQYLSDGGGCIHCGQTASDNLNPDENQKKLEKALNQLKYELKYDSEKVKAGIKEAIDNPIEYYPIEKDEYDRMQTKIHSLRVDKVNNKREIKVLNRLFICMSITAFIFLSIIIWKFGWL